MYRQDFKEWGVFMKRTNIVLDEKIVFECMDITGIKTQKGVIDYALRDLLRKNKQRKLLELRGNVKWDGDLNDLRKERYNNDIG